MFSLLFLFFALSVAYCKERAITNGYDAPYRKFYALLQIFEYGESDGSWNTCGGSIINENYILTAAHCLDGKNGPIYVYVGDSTEPNWKSEATKIRGKAILHPGYDTKNMNDDIALIKLDKSVSSSLAIPLCENSYKDSGDPIAVCGLGFTQVKPNRMPDVLQEVMLKETVSKCDYDFDTSKQICLISPRGKYQDACMGDSGGPAFPLSGSDEAICVYGVVSYGDADCFGNGVYTRVSGYLDWIAQNTAGSDYGGGDYDDDDDYKDGGPYPPNPSPGPNPFPDWPSDDWVEPSWGEWPSW